MMTRRGFVRTSAGLIGSAAPVSLAAMWPDTAIARDAVDMTAREGVMRFRVDRGGSEMGRHVLRFARPSSRQIDVAIDIDLKVTFGPFTLFEYSHRNETTWSGGRIQRLKTRTNDDGDKYTVDAEAQSEDSLRVRTQEETRTVPGDILPTSYWQRATVARTQLLNTQNGALAEVAVAPLGARPQKLPNGKVQADGFEMSGDVRVKVWYDPDGRWVGMSFDGKGERVTYELIERAGFIPLSAASSDTPTNTAL